MHTFNAIFNNFNYNLSKNVTQQWHAKEIRAQKLHKWSGSSYRLNQYSEVVMILP